jgi:tripartite-type tricarboxylate transporter receptor subunit TctC
MLFRTLIMVAVVLAAPFAPAQSWPTKPIRIIVPFPPGGTTDQIARHVQPHLERSLGVSIVIDNRGGASGVIGTNLAAKAQPDGYTWLLVFDTHGVNPALVPDIPYDTVKDFSPVMLIGKSPMVITVHPSTPYKTFADVLAAARGQAGGVSLGTIGAGSLAHLAMTLISKGLKVPLTHVPYKGGGPLIIDAVAGHVPVAIASAALLGPYIKDGRLRAIAVTSPTRFPQLPNVPTISEQGLPRFDAESWWGLLAPAKTPALILARMHDEMAKALRQPVVQERLEPQGLVFYISSPDALGNLIESEIARWAKVVKENKITAGE